MKYQAVLNGKTLSKLFKTQTEAIKEAQIQRAGRSGMIISLREVNDGLLDTFKGPDGKTMSTQ
jgi:hypothetical protein|tara:strand:- start:423 stop:611 length:189 start_codon:yes stop_codon:yes gene_type:complete